MRIKTLLNFLVIVASSLSADAVELCLKPKAESNGSLVLLGDVAEIHGATDEHRVALERIELFPTPTDQRGRALHARELRELLALQDVNVQELRFTGARLARISAASKDRPHTAEIQSASLANAQVVVATRKLNRGDVIREADVALRKLDQLSPATTLTETLAEVVGKETLQPLQIDQPIDRRQLRRPLLVHRGETLRVVARAAGVQVFTTARATEDGALGDIIVLQSLENREKYAAQVTGLQQAEVYASGVLANDPVPPRTAVNETTVTR